MVYYVNSTIVNPSFPHFGRLLYPLSYIQPKPYLIWMSISNLFENMFTNQTAITPRLDLFYNKYTIVLFMIQTACLTNT